MNTVNTILNFIIEHWEFVGALIYEILARAIPTKKNISLLDNAWKILDWIVRNKRKPDGSENIVGTDSKGNPKNFITIRTDKHALTILFLLCAFAGFSQSPVISQQRAAMFTNPGTQDTVLIKNTRTSLQSINGNTGGLYFDKVRNKWRIWIGTCAGCPTDSTWVDLIGLGNGLITASNGLTKTGSNIVLGGALTGNTSLTGNFSLTMPGGTTNAGLIFGSVAGNPSSLVNGASWYNSSTGNINFRVGGSTSNAVTVPITGNHNVQYNVPYFSSTDDGYLNGSAALLSVDPALGAAGVVKLAGQHFYGYIPSNPSSPQNGSVWYNTSTDELLARINGSNVSLGASSTASNGLTKVSNDIQLGGSATADINVNPDGHLIAFGDGATFSIGTDDGGGGQVFMASDEVTFGITPGAGGAIYEDSRATKTGIQYAADYSATYTDRSLVDAGYAKQSTYVPTFTGVANVTSTSIVGSSWTWCKVGKMVTVQGAVSIDATANTTLTQVGFSLPIASNFTDLGMCTGNIVNVFDTPSGTYSGGEVIADTTNDRASCNFISKSTNPINYYITFSYRIN